MFMKNKSMDSHGFTLIEIIASIAILGMVIAALLPIFPQIFSWTKSTENQLTASHLLGQVAADLQDLDIHTIAVCPNAEQISAVALGEYATYQLNNKTYNVHVDVCQTSEEKKYGLIRAHFVIEADGKKSESFTYIRGEQNNAAH